MLKAYLIDGKLISSNPQYRGTALRAISHFGESRPSYCGRSLEKPSQHPNINSYSPGDINYLTKVNTKCVDFTKHTLRVSALKHKTYLLRWIIPHIMQLIKIIHY